MAEVAELEQRSGHEAAQAGRERGRRFFDEYRVELAMLGALALLCLVLSVVAPNFLTAGNIRNVLWQVTAIGIIAIGQTFVILTGGIDLSVGGIAALSAMVGGLLMTVNGEERVAIGLIGTLLVGLIVGTANGLIIAYGRLAPFIVTLGMLSIANSLTYVISDAKSVVGLPDAYRYWGRGEILGIPIYLVTFIALFILGQVFLARTKPGRFLYAIGSNEEAARLSGVNVRFYKTLPYAITAGVSLIILSPTDSSSAPTVLEVAGENNVPVVIADIGTDEGDFVSFVISTNEQGAYEAGQVLMEEMKEKGCEGSDVLMITISQARLNGQNRTKGITKAVEDAGSSIVQFLQSEDYTRVEAQTQASDMLSANPEACGFFTQHDEAALGALTAIEESGRADGVVFASFDGSPESVELIKQGKLVAASMQQPVLMGRISMEVGLKHLRGEEVEKETSVPTILVTPDNVVEIETTLQDTVFPVDDGAATPTA